MTNNNNNNIELTIRLDGPAPEKHDLQAYDIGTILIATQRMVGAIGSFELGRQDSPFRDISRSMDSKPPFMRANAVQCRIRDSRYGSFEIQLALMLWRELSKFNNNLLIVSFLISVLANFFTTIANASGKSLKDRFRTNRPIEHQLSEQQLTDLTNRVLPPLTTVVNKIDWRSGIDHLHFDGKVTKSGLEWNINIGQNERRKINSFADRSVAPAGKYRGFLRALNLEDRTGIFLDSYSQDRFELVVHRVDLCERLAAHMNKEIILLASLDTRRNVEDRRLRTLLIVEDFQILDEE